MISRGTDEFQTKHDWEATDLPKRLQSVMRQRDALRQELAELADLVVQYNKIDPSDWEFPDLVIHMTRAAKGAQELLEAMDDS